MTYVAPEKTFMIRQKAAVAWFNIEQLVATAAKTIAASIIGPMSGRRELMAALDPPNGRQKGYLDLHDKGPELWLDYLADTGDGWNATASVAWLLGRDSLLLDEDGGPLPQPIPPGQEELQFEASEGQIILPQGSVLIAGGDRASADKRAALRKKGAQVLVLPTRGRRLTLAPLLEHLGGQAVTSLLVEGGAEIYASFLNEGLVDKLYLFYAPILIGGAGALGMVGGTGSVSVAGAVKVKPGKCRRLAGDILLEATLAI